ncbi:MAG TPA: ABC transporter substrate-binding protein [Acidimicrobiales bacterium]|nr:ABC transporter substrate-binding protein [Acidimicrobiales bacterium]
MVRLRPIVSAGIAAMALLACTDGEQATSGTSPGGARAPSEATGPAPGVTDETVKVGAVYVDTSALEAVGLTYDLGDYEATYQALADDINDGGGINGRTLEMVVVPFDATTTTPGEAQCLQLTEDEDVFVVTGLFLADAVLCPLEAHATAVVGGTMNPTRQQRAQAPWLSWLPDDEAPAQIVETLADRGELDGKVAVFAATATQNVLEDTVVPALHDAGVDPVATGIMDAPPDDTAAVQSSVRLIAERFDAAGADTIVFVGADGANWPTVMADDPSYRPKLLFLDQAAPRAFATSAATTDTSILEGSLSGGGYGPDQARYDEPAMQDCLATLEAAGIDTPAPEDFDPDDRSNQPYQAAFQACPDMAIIRAWLEAAGDDLHYGTLDAAIDGLEVHIPGEPGTRTYGPGPGADGDPAAYLYRWDESSRGFELVDDD